MFLVKHTIVSTAGLVGGVFGYVSAESDAWVLMCAFGGMLACACVADLLTEPLEVSEYEDDANADSTT